ncbi:hypothetical protein D3H65_17485 [Paraflavitalea soli]|uniref:Uncharacterized protein n=1 Tax=Paraflavitalea soli TaxID=2315862 RepID=A0A3B7MNE1_9BACT|nr:hypothetical protein D3H65_17485 [Paraflavitalea soli]
MPCGPCGPGTPAGPAGPVSPFLQDNTAKDKIRPVKNTAAYFMYIILPGNVVRKRSRSSTLFV